jgi:hypothetical protein
MDDRISAPLAARLIGIKTATLPKWRCRGKAPKGSIRISPTHGAKRILRPGSSAGRLEGEDADDRGDDGEVAATTKAGEERWIALETVEA